MQNILLFLVKIQTNVNLKKHVHNRPFVNVSHTVKIEKFDHKNWSVIVLYKNHSLPR